MARPKINGTRINAYVPDKYWELTTTLARSRGISASEVLRLALKQYLVQEYRNEQQRDEPAADQ